MSIFGNGSFRGCAKGPKRIAALVLVLLIILCHVPLEPSVALSEKPVLNLFLILGQSNAEGITSANIDSKVQLARSILCDEKNVFSSYMPMKASIGKSVTGVSFSRSGSSEAANYFVPASLSGNLSLAGTPLDYPLNSLSKKGKGKTGIDSGLAYEWNRLTGEKVWVANAAVNGASVVTWVPGGSNYKSSTAFFDGIMKTYKQEILKGNYARGKVVLFWLQGEKDKNMSPAAYEKEFKKVYESYTRRYFLDGFGIISVRRAWGEHRGKEDISLNGPRTAQYAMSASTEFRKLFMVSDVNEKWIDSAGVADYFSKQYPSGKLRYPVRGGSALSIPRTVNEVHYDIHYSQIGHNENGITAARGMFEALYGKPNPDDIFWLDEDCNRVKKITLQIGDSQPLIYSTEPVSSAKGVKVKITEGKDLIDYDRKSGIILGKKAGSATIVASATNGSKAVLKIKIVKKPDFRKEVGTGFTGLHKSAGKWYYLKNGVADTGYEGLVKNSRGYWFVHDGTVDFGYTGIVKSGKGDGNYYFVRKGKYDNTFTGLSMSYVNGEYYFVRRGKVDWKFTGFARSITNGKYYFARNGQLDWNFTGIGKSITDGKYYFARNGRYDSKFTGIAKSAVNGRFYFVRNGRLDQSFTGLAKSVQNGRYYYVKNGSLDWDYTGIATSYTNGRDYYVRSGEWDRSKSGIVRDSRDGNYYYVKGGAVMHDYSGRVVYGGIGWTVKNGVASREKE